MSLRVTCLQWFNAELRIAQILTAVLVGELCKAAYDLLEAAAPLTYKQQQSIRRYMAKLLSHITRATSDCNCQSRIVWPSEETRLLSLEYHTLISRWCRHLLKGELQRRWCLEFIIVCRLCQAAHTLLEAAPPLTIGLRRSMRRFTVNLQSHIKRVTRRCDSQSNDVWPLRKAMLEYAYADLMSALCECAHNILRGTVRLTPGEKVRPRKYKNKLRLIANRRLSIARKRREIQQTGGFLPALLAPLAATVFLPLLSQLFA